jgi:hypothetical protein
MCGDLERTERQQRCERQALPLKMLNRPKERMQYVIGA